MRHAILRLLGWSNRPGDGYFIADTATRAQMCLEADGPPLLVEQDGDWLPARLVKTDGQTITAQLLGKRPREVTVKPAQVRYPFAGHSR